MLEVHFGPSGLGRRTMRKLGIVATVMAWASLGASWAMADTASPARLPSPADGIAATAIPAAAPLVKRTNPAALSDSVDPALDQISVTFDRPMMDQCWSWTGGGETMPQMIGQPSYDAGRTTCKVQVKLEPGKVYCIGVNSPSYKHFMSSQRVPAPWYVIVFATRSAEGKSTPIPSDLVTQAQQINAAHVRATPGAAGTQPATRPATSTSQPARSGQAMSAQDASAAPLAIQEGTAAVVQWLKLVDASEYAQAWEQSAELFRNAVPKEAFGTGIAAVRSPLGMVESRKLLSASYTTALPGAAAGQYVVFQFDTTFQNKKDAVETITPMKDKDGTWRVSGYYVK